MGRVLSQLRIENYHTKELIYSKLVRGGLSFIVELHELDKGRKFQIYLYRDHPRIKEFLAAGIEKELFPAQPSECKLNAGTIRLGINDTNFMLNTNGDTEIKIQEYNSGELTGRIIEKKTDFENKMKRLVKEITSFLGLRILSELIFVRTRKKRS